MKKKILLIGILVCMIFSFSLGAYAQTRAYITDEWVYKTGSANAYSNSTGTNIYQVFYAAKKSSGTLKATVQYYNSGSYVNVTGSTRTAGDTMPSWGTWSCNIPPYKVFRLMLSGSTGRGEGHIQGQE